MATTIPNLPLVEFTNLFGFRIAIAVIGAIFGIPCLGRTFHHSLLADSHWKHCSTLKAVVSIYLPPNRNYPPLGLVNVLDRSGLNRFVIPASP
jgi:hypothetical protein